MLKRRILLVVPVVVTAASACGSEEDHGTHEFASHEECITHYESEGYTPDEVEELCADHEDESHEES